MLPGGQQASTKQSGSTAFPASAQRVDAAHLGAGLLESAVGMGMGTTQATATAESAYDHHIKERKKELRWKSNTQHN